MNTLKKYEQNYRIHTVKKEMQFLQHVAATYPNHPCPHRNRSNWQAWLICYYRALNYRHADFVNPNQPLHEDDRNELRRFITMLLSQPTRPEKPIKYIE